MNKIISCCLIAFIICLQLKMNGQDQLLQKEIDKIIKHEANIDFDIVSGVMVGVIDGESNYLSTHGVALSPDSLYELGSATKPFVSWLVKQALDSLGWRLDDSICNFLPDSICNKYYRKLTFKHILDHRSGLPRLPPDIGAYEKDINDPYRSYDVDHLAKDLLGFELSPGNYLYSHVGYALLYWLFEEVGGLSGFSDSQFNQKLGLTKTVWTADDEFVAQGHGMDGRLQPPWHTGALATAMGLKSNVYDLLSFIRAISPELASRQKQDFRKEKKEINSLTKKGEYKLSDGWFLVPMNSSIVYYHTGRTGGHHVSIAFIPKTMKGVIVVSNSSLGSNELSLAVLRMLNRAKE